MGLIWKDERKHETENGCVRKLWVSQPKNGFANLVLNLLEKDARDRVVKSAETLGAKTVGTWFA